MRLTFTKMQGCGNDYAEAKMCGNGIRCVGQYLYDHHMKHLYKIIDCPVAFMKYPVARAVQ